jgi:hypothetical protein
MIRRTAYILSVVLMTTLALFAGEKINERINWQIRQEANVNSQIMKTMHFFTDLYGPRLTGTPRFKESCEWAIEQMKEWGMVNAHLETWDFGRPGWVNEKLSAHMTAPLREPLVCEPVAWAPGTKGAVSGQAVQIVPPQGPTEEEFAGFLSSVKAKVAGKIVLVGEHQFVPVTFNFSPKRREDAEVRARYDPDNPAPQARRPTPQGPQEPREGPKRLSGREIDEKLSQFFIDNGVLVRVLDAGRAHGQIRGARNRSYDESKDVPGVIMRNEDYGRISRILADGTPVELEFDISNRFYPEGETTYNAIAEIPGTYKKDEVVMLGGHLDGVHPATGAADNAIGCAVMMEAARILKAIGVRPRRTIRVALWGGEEQGLLGSKAYVRDHFGTFESPKAEFSKLVAYINQDSGTGRPRGLGVFGPPEAGRVLREILKPFEDLGVMGASTTRSRRAGGTDSTSFNAAGLPGIGISQDPIEYGTHTWHTNLDTYERIVEQDAIKSATIVASVVYHLSMREEMLPRFKKEEMPEPTQPPAEMRPTGNR